jgi:hypothetical protein
MKKYFNTFGKNRIGCDVYIYNHVMRIVEAREQNVIQGKQTGCVMYIYTMSCI